MSAKHKGKGNVYHTHSHNISGHVAAKRQIPGNCDYYICRTSRADTRPDDALNTATSSLAFENEQLALMK